jgi:hypothetical protein
MALADKAAGADARAMAVEAHVGDGGHDTAVVGVAGRTRCPAMKSKAVGGAARQSIGQPGAGSRDFLLSTSDLGQISSRTYFLPWETKICFPSIIVVPLWQTAPSPRWSAAPASCMTAVPRGDMSGRGSGALVLRHGQHFETACSISRTSTQREAVGAAQASSDRAPYQLSGQARHARQYASILTVWNARHRLDTG